MLTVAIRSSLRLGEELAVALVDLHEGAVRRLDAERPPPLLVDDRALRREPRGAQPALDGLERLLRDEVQRQPVPALAVGGNGGVVQADLAAGGLELDPVPGARPGRGAQ